MGRLDTKALVLAMARAAAISTLTLKTSRHIPRGIKWFILFLVALNIRGFPLVWHGKFTIHDPIHSYKGRIILIRLHSSRYSTLVRGCTEAEDCKENERERCTPQAAYLHLPCRDEPARGRRDMEIEGRLVA
jgi:hypothetical protein